MSDVDTMAGYLITALGMIPDEGEKLSFDVDNITLVSEEMEGSRILKIRVIFMIRKKQKRNLKKNEDTSEKNSKMTSQEDN